MLVKNCIPVGERAGSSTARGGKSQGGGGAEMIYILLSALYKLLPSRWCNDLTGPTFHSILEFVLPNRSSMTNASIGGDTNRSGCYRRNIRNNCIEEIKCYTASALAALADTIDGAIARMYTEKSLSYLLESVYILSNFLCSEKHIIQGEEFSDSWADKRVYNDPISPLAAMLLEHLGDCFLKSNIYKLAILSYESCLAVHLKLSTELDKKLYRKLSLVAQEAGMQCRCLSSL